MCSTALCSRRARVTFDQQLPLNLLPQTPATRLVNERQAGREMLRSVAGCTAIPRQRSPRARPLHVAASRHGPTTTLHLSGPLHPVDLRVLDDMTVWLLTWDSHRLVIDIDDLTGSDALFTTWICKRQRSARLIGDHVVAHTSNPHRRAHLITAGVVCDAP